MLDEYGMTYKLAFEMLHMQKHVVRIHVIHKSEYSNFL